MRQRSVVVDGTEIACVLHLLFWLFPILDLFVQCEAFTTAADLLELAICPTSLFLLLLSLGVAWQVLGSWTYDLLVQVSSWLESDRGLLKVPPCLSQDIVLGPQR